MSKHAPQWPALVLPVCAAMVGFLVHIIPNIMPIKATIPIVKNIPPITANTMPLKMQIIYKKYTTFTKNINLYKFNV